jgi:hypothetical protein
MKKLLILLVLLFALPAHGQVELARMSPAMVGGGVAVVAPNECAGYLICQNFETATTGYDNSESWAETTASCTAFDHAYTTTHLRGAQSLYISDISAHNCQSVATFTASDEIWVGMRVNVTVNPTDTQRLFELWDASNNVLLKVYVQPDGYANTKHGTADTAYGSVTAHSDNQLYYIWVRWTKSTDTNGVTEFYSGTVRTSADRVKDTGASATNGNATAQVAKIALFVSGYTEGVVYDQILVKTTDFGDFPN